MVVLQVQAFEVAIDFFERNPPIAGDRHAPCTPPVPHEPMYSPTTGRVVDEVFHVGGQEQNRQDAPDSARQLRWKKPGCVVLEETAQSSMTDRTNDQDECVR